MGTDAFQEVDIFGITLPIVKHSFVIRDTADIPRIFAEAFRIARIGPAGPGADRPAQGRGRDRRGSARRFDLPARRPERRRRRSGGRRAPTRSIADATAPSPLLRRRRRHRPRRARAARIRRAHRHPVRRDAEGPRRHADRRRRASSACSGMHGSARREHRDRPLRPADLRRRALRRPRHRQARQLRARARRSFTSTAIPPRSASCACPKSAWRAISTAILDRLTAPAHMRPAGVQQCRAQKAMWAPRYDAPGGGVYAPALLKAIVGSRRRRRRSSPATSASTRCGWRSIAASAVRRRISPAAASARWATASRPASGACSPSPTRPWSPSRATDRS